MFTNFFSPSNLFSEGIETASYFRALILVIVTGLLIGVAGYLITNDIANLLFLVILNILQWFVLTSVLWFLNVSYKGKKKSATSFTFEEVACAVGNLWMVLLANSVFILVGIVLLTNTLFWIIGAILIILIFLSLLYSYILVKTVLETEGAKAVIAWGITLILFLVLTTFIRTIAFSLVGA